MLLCVATVLVGFVWHLQSTILTKCGSGIDVQVLIVPKIPFLYMLVLFLDLYVDTVYRVGLSAMCLSI